MRPRPSRIDKRNDAGITVEIAFVMPKVGDVEDLFGLGEAIERSARLIAHDDCWFPPEPVGVAKLAVYRHRAKVVSLSQEQIADFGFAYTSRILQHRVKYRLKLAGRARDHVNELARRA